MNLVKRALKVPISEIMTILGVAGALVLFCARMFELGVDRRSFISMVVLICAGALAAIILRARRENEEPPPSIR